MARAGPRRCRWRVGRREGPLWSPDARRAFLGGTWPDTREADKSTEAAGRFGACPKSTARIHGSVSRSLFAKASEVLLVTVRIASRSCATFGGSPV
jgi:hypothetical protein